MESKPRLQTSESWRIYDRDVDKQKNLKLNKNKTKQQPDP